MGKEKKRFLLRIDMELYEALEKWSSDELRSINGQIEFLLATAAKKMGRYPCRERGDDDSEEGGDQHE